MTPNDWLYDLKDEFNKVLNDSDVFVKGIKTEVDGLMLSLTITEQDGYYEAYVVSEPKENRDIEDAVRSVKQIRDVIGEEDEKDKRIGKHNKKEEWAEKHFKIDKNKINTL